MLPRDLREAPVPDVTPLFTTCKADCQGIISYSALRPARTPLFFNVLLEPIHSLPQGAPCSRADACPKGVTPCPSLSVAARDTLPRAGCHPSKRAPCSFYRWLISHCGAMLCGGLKLACCAVTLTARPIIYPRQGAPPPPKVSVSRLPPRSPSYRARGTSCGSRTPTRCNLLDSSASSRRRRSCRSCCCYCS